MDLRNVWVGIFLIAVFLFVLVVVRQIILLSNTETFKRSEEGFIDISRTNKR